MKDIFLSALMIVGLNLPCFAAQNAADIYLLAQAKSATELKKVENIDIINPNGDTALCTAIKYNDVDAYNILKKAGANTQHQCIKNIPTKQYDSFIEKVRKSQRKTFLGLSKWGWGLIGTGAIAGGAVAAMGGGSGGGGATAPVTSKEPNDNELDDNKSDAPIVLNCVHGTQTGNICACNMGYTGKLCDALSDGYIEQNGTAYPKKNCIHGTQNGNTCTCDTGYTGILCDTVANGFIEQDGNIYNKLNCVHGNQVGNSCVCGSGYVGELCDSYKVYDPNKDKYFDPIDFVSGSGPDEEKNIVKTSTVDTNTYGVYNDNTEIMFTYNAVGDNSIGNIIINNDSTTDAYGVYSAGRNSVNAGPIYYTTDGLGYVAVTSAGTMGTITIDNNSSGNVYGVATYNEFGSASNAYHTNNTGIININNNLSGNAYGVYSGNSSASNAKIGSVTTNG